MSTRSSSPLKEPIAIIGSACHFAGGINGPSKLWDLLHSPRDVRNEIPADRFNARGYYHPNPAQHGHSNIMHSYLIEDEVTAFDAEFFGVKPVEAQAMDPQQRMLMETVYEAIEAAGLTIQGLRESDTGVFVGVMCADYDALQLRDMDSIPTYLATGTARSILSSRISYFFDWHGPSITTDTACSSSLVAVHQAVQSLRAGESSVAVACGSNLILGPENFIMESKLNMLSPDGVGKMWDESANGYARGEGVATLVLKPLSSAIADGDHIECLIRETGVNQDGATAGLTMPSATAQQALIEQTYAKAGLDLRKREDRPQLFEAHGTGTPAGDPVEARAISMAFFDHGNGSGVKPGHELSVGSIKTILGHTEGTAGIAGILRASLAIQNAKIPANLHFHKLNPAIVPFYDGLEVPTTTKAWPDVLGAPRRASVNSFGFGGTNAHAILESWDRPLVPKTETMTRQLYTPYVFSALNEKSLKAYLVEFAAYLDDPYSLIDADDLAYTLRQRRSAFPHRVTFTANTLRDLQQQIIATVQGGHPDGAVTTRASGPSRAHAVLGIFTGQGAQYPRMGAALVEQSQMADLIIRDLERHLSCLPEADRPGWSLRSELLASSSTSRVRESSISQPLCTAVQILLVDLLRTAGIHFSAVVGHSSGEIAAAYAAGCLTARDAMVIAYYRGLYCELAASPNGSDIRGAMLAVGTTMADATELCEDSLFAGRICVAACNSSSSVTISGDEDAIAELQEVLADENKFHRRLWVDRAYHSPHMKPCLDAYVQSLHRANVKYQTPSPGSRWYSSVYDGTLIELTTAPTHAYWADNMLKPVLFNQALTEVLSSHSSIELVLEVGPHPALKGPSVQTIQEVLGRPIPYHGCLDRNSGAVEAMSKCMGFLWSHLEASSGFGLNAYECAMSGRDLKTERLSVVKGLPSYHWDHDVKHWHESRRSRRMRLRGPSHSLLGDESPDSSSHHRCWRNILKPSEMEWLDGHRVQGQLVFPAAGYVTTALEAARVLAGGREIRLIEILDFTIHRAVTFDTDTSAVEALIALSHIIEDDTRSIRANFTYSASLESDSEDSNLSLVSEGQVRIVLGVTSLNILPRRRPLPPHLLELEQSRLYGFMEGLGYSFSGSFRLLENLQRKHGWASCHIATPPALHHLTGSQLLIHPAEVDAAFQSIMLAHSYPGDGQLRSLHLPASIKRLRVNPTVCASESVSDGGFDVDSVCNRKDRAANGSAFSGDFNLYTTQCSNAAIRAEGVKFVPFSEASSADRNVFYKMDWVPCTPDGAVAAAGIAVQKADMDFLKVLSRVAAYYLRKFDTEVAEDAPARHDQLLGHYLSYARHMTDLLRKGEHKFAEQEWLKDTLDDVMDNIRQLGFSDRADLKLALLVGEMMPRVFNQETTMIEHMRTSGLLDEYYSGGFGMRQSSSWLSQVLKQITDRHPHLNILEVGAGTGGATKDILSIISGGFSTYTFTDVSSSFFADAAEVLEQWKDRTIFKVLDLEGVPDEQGFGQGQYDVIVASFVIHATARLDKTLRNLRRLLRPGGYLVVGEGTSDGPLQSGDGFIFGPLPGWWLGVDEGRALTPFINLDQWDTLLKGTGFSGIDSAMPQGLSDAFGLALFVSQAVDDRITFLRSPLDSTGCPTTFHPKIPKLIIVGGITEPTRKVVEEVGAIFKNLASEITHYISLEDLPSLDESASIICLAELDAPCFKDMTQERWNSFKKMFETAKTLLWISTGRLADQPWSNMPVGFGRTALNETLDLHAQFLDFPSIEMVEPREIAQGLLRLQANDLSSDELLWTDEPEVTLDEKGNHLVPRLRSIGAANDRYNSAQRRVFHEVNLEERAVELQQTADKCITRELSRYEVEGGRSTRTGTIKLRTTSSVLSALKTKFGHQFLTMSIDRVGRRYVCLVPKISNFVEVSEHNAVPYEPEGNSFDESGHLAAVSAHLLVHYLLSSVYPGQKVAMYNPSPVMAQAMKHQASLKGVSVLYYATEYDDDQSPCSNNWKMLSPYASRSEVLDVLPVSQIVLFAGLFGMDDPLQRENGETMMSVLSSNCQCATAETIFALDGNEVGSAAAIELAEVLKTAVNFAHDSPTLETHVQDTISLAAVTTNERPKNPLTILDWVSSTKVSAQVSRLDGPEGKCLFKADKTYWVCGMSGALGISLCDWMIESGAKYIVITSRNPKIESTWVENHQSNGVTVKIMSCDVTDETALRAVHHNIVQSMPSIAGALNGAMVLRDSSIPNMSYEDVVDVVNPKVLGSLYLDRIFYDTALDFFILVSSITAVVGNVGQANYAAANMYMCALAANRRKRGLNAVALNGGAIIGAGYITRETDRALDLTVEKMALMRLSEEDFHQMIAEAIESGHVDCPDGVSEITTGLLDIAPDSANIPKWYRNPKFSRFIVQQSAGANERTEQTAAASIQDQLRACQTHQELVLLVEQAFISQLRKLLLTPPDVADEVLLSKRSTELGIDSLVSVDLRSWCMKNFKASIPVLKIMGSDSMARLVDTIVESVPAEIVPDLEFDTDTKDSISTTSASTSLGSETTSSLSSPISLSQPAFIDWDAESMPPAGLAEVALTETGPVSGIPPKLIVVTGVTGHLGPHLLQSFLNGTAAEIHCLAVRKLATRLHNKELLVDPRIQYHEGDLADPLLGLSEADAASIFARADAAIHNGADTSHAKLYGALRASNVGSTVTLVRLCLPRRVPLHYVSSAGVCIFYGSDSFPPVPVTGPGSLLPAPDGSFGYASSKWVNERLLERVHAEHGLPVCIYRPSTIMRRGTDATSSRAELDWVNALLWYTRRIGAAPQVRHNRGALDLVRTETCCDGVVGRVLGGISGARIEYVNQVGDAVIPMDSVRDVDADKGRRYDVLPLDQWLNRAVEAGLHPGVSDLIRKMDAADMPSYPRLLKE